MDQRTEGRLPIDCAVTYSGYKLEVEAIVTNLSKNGCGLDSERPIQPGTPLFLSVSLPDSEEPLEIELATVQWWQDGKVGLKTVIMGLDSRERLESFLQGHLHAQASTMTSKT
jgi:hypothetical protein